MLFNTEPTDEAFEHILLGNIRVFSSFNSQRHKVLRKNLANGG